MAERIQKHGTASVGRSSHWQMLTGHGVANFTYSSCGEQYTSSSD